ncbi:Uncharacterised protein [Mycobacteroides abscessus subsp. massiliense]|nr:Uncharacterised protein [Mycobacteroides abscessus subsp. massiliense]
MQKNILKSGIEISELGLMVLRILILQIFTIKELMKKLLVKH